MPRNPGGSGLPLRFSGNLKTFSKIGAHRQCTCTFVVWGRSAKAPHAFSPVFPCFLWTRQPSQAGFSLLFFVVSPLLLPFKMLYLTSPSTHIEPTCFNFKRHLHWRGLIEAASPLFGIHVEEPWPENEPVVILWDSAERARLLRKLWLLSSPLPGSASLSLASPAGCWLWPLRTGQPWNIICYKVMAKDRQELTAPIEQMVLALCWVNRCSRSHKTT